MKKVQPTLKLGIALAVVCALALATLVWTPVRKTTSANALPPAARVSVGVIVHIGKPGTCKGFGICKIELGGALSKRSVKGTLTLEDNGKLSLAIPGNVPDQEPTLVLDRELPLHDDIAKKLGLKSAAIAQGSYPFSAGRAVLDARLVR
jgi:hypothetical protein